MTLRSILTLTAADLMSRDLVVIPREMSLRSAAHRLAQSRISGAPVVDGTGRCVGVLSSTDFLRCVEKGKTTAEPEAWNPDYCSDWAVPDIEALPTDSVAGFMTRNLVTVPPAIGIGALAERMLDAHIHRVIVVNEQHKPIGVVSATDILAAVARADRVAHEQPLTV